VRSVVALLILAAGLVPAAAGAPPPGTIRIATFNCSLNRPAAGGLRASLATPDDAQARAVAEIIQRVRPDILLLQEFDHDAGGDAARAFQSNYLARSQNGARPIEYRYTFFTESNTGQPSGLDLNNDGAVGGGQDALGFGEFPGQYAMLLLSRFPIDTARARTFRKFLWRDMPLAALPDDAAVAGGGDWYSPRELAVLPLSSKSHWDVPVRAGSLTLHVLASHPTPPAFDGREDRNGLRNHDEIRLWVDYLTPGAGTYISDDQGGSGGFTGPAFVLMGDLNSDPVDGASLHVAIQRLLKHERVNAVFTPASEGAVEASATQGAANASHAGEARHDTADFNDRVAGNLRVDYLLPSRELRVCDGGVFWPRRDQPHAALVWGERESPSSDHRLVWLDITSAQARCPRGNGPTASAASRPGR
jgi:endonuclease/exonuclease/phosphatase family metal-dependent hydrolase